MALRLACLLAAALLTGCGWWGSDAPTPEADTTAVAPTPLDTTVPIALDTAAFAPPVTALPASPDSVVVRAAMLDSVLQELATLRALVTNLQPGAPRAARPDTVQARAEAAADTTTVREQLVGTGQDLVQGVRFTLFRTVLALLVLLATYFLIRGLLWLLDVLSERSATRRLFFKKLIPITRLIIWAAAIYYIIASVYGISGERFIALSAGLAVGIGFAAQDILKNIFGGIIIILDQPFQVGDKISVAGTYGEVVSIGLRSTRIVTPDDNLVSVPNAQVVDGQVANANAGALDCQVVVDLYVPGWVDVSRAKALAYQAAANSKFVYLDKPIVVNVKDEFKETFLTNLKVKAYVLDTRYEFAFASDITETAKAEFLRAGLLMPLTSVAALPGGDGPPAAPAPPTAPEAHE